MKEFKFENSAINKIIIEHFRDDERIYNFEKKVNSFLSFLNDDKKFPPYFKDTIIGRLKYSKIFSMDMKKAHGY